MKKITINEFFKSSEKLAIYPRNRKNANALSKAFDKKLYTWRSGARYTIRKLYDVYGNKPCYDNDRLCSCVDFYKRNGYTIIEFKDVDLS
jgi:hypothetical protein